MNETTKKILLSSVLFIGGFIGGFIFLDKNLVSGIAGGWALGGTVLGWYLTRKWFPPRAYPPITDVEKFCATVISMFRIFVTVLVGLIALPYELIKGIINGIFILVSIKKNRDAAIANSTIENPETET